MRLIKRKSSRIEIKNRVSPQSLHVIRGIKKFFSYFVIILAIFILLTGGYLIYSLSSKKKKIETPDIPQLQNYLFQLKSSEDQLKNLVEKATAESSKF